MGYTERSSVILISAYAERDFADMIVASPAVGFLPKPDISGKAIREILGVAGTGSVSVGEISPDPGRVVSEDVRRSPS